MMIIYDGTVPDVGYGDMNLILAFFVAVFLAFVYFLILLWWRMRQKHGFLVFFTQELVLTVESNLPAVPSLKVLAEGLGNIYFKGVIEDVAKGIEAGDSLAESLTRKRHIFPSLYVKMVAIGEKSGNLAKALREILQHLRTKESFQYNLKAGLAYPSFLIFMAFSILLFIMTFIMPTFAEMSREMEVPLPRLSLFLISFSGWFKHRLFLIALGFFAILGLVVLGLMMNRYSASLNRALMRIPFFGTLMRNIVLVRVSRSLSMFLRFPFPLGEALGAIGEIPISAAFQEGVLSMQKGVEEGERLSDTMHKIGIFPSTSIWFASVGEARGNLEEAFDQIGDFYATAVEGALSKINTLTVPICTIFVGGCIGCIAVGMFSALVAMVEALL